MQIEKIAMDKLNPAKYNPRKDLKAGDPEFEKLKRSVEEFGYLEPAVWNKRTGNIVSGHQRIKVLKHLGHTEADCVIVDLDDNQEKALNIAFNKISGDWDLPLLNELLQDLSSSSFDVTLTGFDLSEINDLFGSDTQVEAKDDNFDIDKAAEDIVTQFHSEGISGT